MERKRTAIPTFPVLVELHARRHDFDLGFAEFAGNGVELAVDIPAADVVDILDCERAHAGAGQRLHCPRADPANADDADVRPA